MEIERLEFEKKLELQKESLKKLEDSTRLSPYQKFLILATCLGFKPCSDIESVYVETPEQAETDKDIRNILEELNLSYSSGWQKMDDGSGNVDENHISLIYRVSNDKASLEQSGGKRYGTNIKKYHREYGVSMGYPSSAVEAFVEKDLLDNSGKYPYTYPPEITEEDKKFLFFSPSRKNWREEVKWLREVVRRVKEVSPEIYNQVMQ